MAATTFTWRPAYGAACDIEPPVRVIKFGDGYEQRQGQGINRQPRAYALLFRRPSDEVAAIAAFLGARGALESFHYTHPGDSAGVFVCRRWRRVNVDVGIDELSATFEEVFE